MRWFAPALLVVLGLGCTGAGPGVPYKAYITNRDSGTVTVIESRSGFPSHTVKVGRQPTYVASASRLGLVLVSNTGDSTVSFIRTRDDSVIATLKTGGLLKGIEVEPLGRYALVADEGGGQVVVVDIASRSVVKRIDVGAEPHNFAFDSASGQAFVTCAATDAVDIIDLASLTKTGSVPSGAAPHNLVYRDGLLAVTSRSRPWVYLSDQSGLLDSIEVSSGHHGIALWSKQGLAYVTGIGSNRVAILDLAERRRVRYIEVGAGPHGIEVSPDGLFYFVTSGRADEVHIINRPHNMGHHIVKSPGFPFWVAIAPTLHRSSAR